MISAEKKWKRVLGQFFKLKNNVRRNLSKIKKVVEKGESGDKQGVLSPH